MPSSASTVVLMVALFQKIWDPYADGIPDEDLYEQTLLPPPAPSPFSLVLTRGKNGNPLLFHYFFVMWRFVEGAVVGWEEKVDSSAVGTSSTSSSVRHPLKFFILLLFCADMCVCDVNVRRSVCPGR